MMRNWLFPIALGLASAAAAAPPQHVEVDYELVRNGSVLAYISQRLEHDGRSYNLSETWKGKGLLSLLGEATRSSRGAVVADGLRPQKFEDRRTGRDTLQAEFDPAAKTPTLQRQDRLSFIWNFAFAPPTTAAPAKVEVTDGKSSSIYVYQAAERERVQTPAGEFDALKLVKRRDNPQEKVTEIWLAVDRHYVPVRILIVEKDGTRLDTLAVKISAQ